MSRTTRIAALIGLLMTAPLPVWAQRVRRPPPESRLPRVEAPEARPADSTSRPKDESGAGGAESAPASEVQERPFSLFGDTKKFNRLGGWGGIGGTMGQFGFGTSMLIMAPAVQEELQLSEEQKKQLAEWMAAMRDRGREMGEAMRAEGEAVMRQMDLGTAMRLMGQLNVLLQENERGIERILTRKQWTRLQQISLQMQGISAVTRPDVARALVLAPEQLEQIQAILAQTQLRQVGYWMQQGMAMRRRFETQRSAGGLRGRPEGEPSQPGVDRRGGAGRRERGPGEAGVGEAVEGRAQGERAAGEGQVADESEEARRARLRREMRQEFESMRDGADRIHDEMVQAVLRILTRRQRAQFERMLGPPFDPDALMRGWDRRRDGQAGEGQAGADAGRSRTADLD
ncbi:MAG: hypothetical protein KatS3mg108_3874 [Isosphaeraceae bacterium]|jgi:hypothetical protein|nr:MAG: hypothetical protein KatS3mg108_3874 [Isosphaeraceae bacterium]